MTTAIQSLNPDGLPDEMLIRLSELAGTILADILSSDKYEEILDEICTEFDPRPPDQWEDERSYLSLQMKASRQLRRHLILVLMDETA